MPSSPWHTKKKIKTHIAKYIITNNDKEKLLGVTIDNLLKHMLETHAAKQAKWLCLLSRVSQM